MHPMGVYVSEIDAKSMFLSVHKSFGQFLAQFQQRKLRKRDGNSHVFWKMPHLHRIRKCWLIWVACLSIRRGKFGLTNVFLVFLLQLFAKNSSFRKEIRKFMLVNSLWCANEIATVNQSLDGSLRTCMERSSFVKVSSYFFGNFSVQSIFKADFQNHFYDIQ